MNKEEILEKLLNMTVERLSRQCLNYEAEIANLQGQILMLSMENNVLKISKDAEKSADNTEE
jgi:hypothetical protein